MAQTHDSPLLKCHLNIINLINFDLDLPGNVFIRYYVFTGGGRRARIDTRKIQSTSELYWNELTSMACRGSLDPIKELLEPRSVVFELRWRRTRRFARSTLLGRGEVAWKDVLASPGMSLEKRVSFVATGPWPVDCKPPALLVRMKVGVSEPVLKRSARRAMWWKDCDCRDCEWNGSEEDMFSAAHSWL